MPYQLCVIVDVTSQDMKLVGSDWGSAVVKTHPGKRVVTDGKVRVAEIDIAHTVGRGQVQAVEVAREAPDDAPGWVRDSRNKTVRASLQQCAVGTV